jgi:hypothetical protein
MNTLQLNRPIQLRKEPEAQTHWVNLEEKSLRRSHPTLWSRVKLCFYLIWTFPAPTGFGGPG